MVEQMHLQLDNKGPKHEQLARSLRQAIRSGQIQSGSKLPSTRMLSENLGLSRNTVLRAYEQLRIERLGVMREGSGTYVSDVPATHVPVAVPRHVEAQSAYAARMRGLPPLTLAGSAPELRYDLQYGAPLVNTKLVSAWGTALATAAATTSPGIRPRKACRSCARPSPGSSRPGAASSRTRATSSSSAERSRPCRWWRGSCSTWARRRPWRTRTTNWRRTACAPMAPTSWACAPTTRAWSSTSCRGPPGWCT